MNYSEIRSDHDDRDSGILTPEEAKGVHIDIFTTEDADENGKTVATIKNGIVTYTDDLAKSNVFVQKVVQGHLKIQRKKLWTEYYFTEKYLKASSEYKEWTHGLTVEHIHNTYHDSELPYAAYIVIATSKPKEIYTKRIKEDSKSADDRLLKLESQGFVVTDSDGRYITLVKTDPFVYHILRFFDFGKGTKIRVSDDASNITAKSAMKLLLEDYSSGLK